VPFVPVSRRRLLLGVAGGCIAPLVFSQTAASVDVAEIIDKNAAARGGVEAWQRLQAMAWTGYVESGARTGHNLHFMLEQKRPGKTRFELVTDGQRSIRIFDGKGGWKLRPNPANGRPELAPYTEDEIRFARTAPVIDGPLMDSVAKGAIVTITGQGEAEGRRAYILKVQLPARGEQSIWIDAETFLEVRQDRQVRAGIGQAGTVTVRFREYREFEGLKLPTEIETGAGIGGAANKLVIERVALNPDLDDHAFARPDVPTSRKNSVIVDTRGAGMGRGAQSPSNRP
jgi:outer membrane lipoprotein-sorting protein